MESKYKVVDIYNNLGILEKFVSVSLMLELARILSEGKGYKSLNRTWPGNK